MKQPLSFLETPFKFFETQLKYSQSIFKTTLEHPWNSIGTQLEQDLGLQCQTPLNRLKVFVLVFKLYEKSMCQVPDLPGDPIATYLTYNMPKS